MVAKAFSLSAHIDELRDENSLLKTENEGLRDELQIARSYGVNSPVVAGSGAIVAELERELFESKAENLVLEKQVAQQENENAHLQMKLNGALANIENQQSLMQAALKEAEESRRQLLNAQVHLPANLPRCMGVNSGISKSLAIPFPCPLMPSPLSFFRLGFQAGRGFSTAAECSSTNKTAGGIRKALTHIPGQGCSAGGASLTRSLIPCTFMWQPSEDWIIINHNVHPKGDNV